MSIAAIEPISSLLIVLIYHTWLVYLVVHDPQGTVVGLARSGRRRWCEVIAKRGDGILAVQTLRNWLMVSTLLATVSVTLVVGLAALLGQVKTAEFPETHDGVGVKGKIIILICCFASSFFCFTQAMRYFIHTGFLATASFGLPKPSPSSQPLSGTTLTIEDPSYESFSSFENDIRTLSALLNTGGLFHTLGLRGFYLTFPVILWLFGEWLLLGSTLVLTTLLVIFDLNWDWILGRVGRGIRL